MKNYSFLLCAFILLTAHSSFAQYSESGKASLILTHEPGEELFTGVIHPAAALFEEYMDLEKVVAEHRNYRARLEAAGADVVTVRDILLEGTTDKKGAAVEGEKLNGLRRLAGNFLSFDTDGLSPGAAPEQERCRQEVLAAATPEDLVRIILLQPGIGLSSTDNNTGITAEYRLRPVMNLFYMRDQMITTAKGSVIGRMNSPQREKECDIAEFCLDKLGIPALHRITGDGAYLEGGDFYPFGNTAFIGCGMRTTQKAIDQLMERDLLGCDSLIVVKDRRFSQAEMHLDTYFNIVDRDLFTLSTARMTADPASSDLLLADLYIRRPDGRYEKAVTDFNFLQYLTGELNGTVIPIAKEDQARMANNFLTIAPRRIMAVAGQSEELQQKFSEAKVEVEWIPLDNLRKGYGAAHCMTQVLRRK